MAYGKHGGAEYAVCGGSASFVLVSFVGLDRLRPIVTRGTTASNIERNEPT